MRKPAVFLDRDGILNALVHDEALAEPRSPRSVDQLTLFRQAPPFVRALNERGFLVLVVTNQPDLAWGRMSSNGLHRIHGRLKDEVATVGGRIDGVFFCPHDEAAPRETSGEYSIPCRCRFPGPGLILRSAQQHNVDLARSFMICKNLKEVKSGRSAAVETVLLSSSKLSEIEASPDLRPHHVVRALPDVLRIIDAASEASGIA